MSSRSQEPSPARLDALRLALVPEFTPRRIARFLEARAGCRDPTRSRADLPAGLARASRASAAALRRGAVREFGAARRIAAALVRADPAAEWKRVEEAGLGIVVRGETSYPADFEALTDPPPVLYHRGAPEAGDRVRVALVGMRRPSAYGQRMARSLAGDLARAGITVIVERIHGVSAAAAGAAAAAGGRTWTFCRGGLLYAESEWPVASGPRVAWSEMPLHSPPGRGAARRVQRLVAAAAPALVAIEPADFGSGGAAIQEGLSLGREIMAVPGPADAERGNALRLLREGATPVGCLEDVLCSLGLREPGRPSLLPAPERSVLEALADGPRDLDELASCTGRRLDLVAALVLSLQLRGLLQRTQDGRFVSR